MHGASDANYQLLSGDPNPQEVLRAAHYKQNSSQFALDHPAETHTRVINYEHRELLENSRLNNTMLHFLRALDHSAAWRTAVSTTAGWLLLLIINFAIDGRTLIKKWIDQEHYSDGAKPSEDQQQEDYETAKNDLILFFTLTPIFFVVMAVTMYWWRDVPKYMRGYSKFREITALPEYGQFDEKQIYLQLRKLINYLFNRFHGLIGMAHLICNLQYYSQFEEISLPPSATDDHFTVVPLSPAPSYAGPSSSQPSTYTPLPHQAADPHFLINIPIARGIVDQIQQENPNFFNTLSARLAGHDAQLRLVQPPDSSTLYVMIVHNSGDLYPRLEHLERTLQNHEERLNRLETSAHSDAPIPRGIQDEITLLQSEVTRFSQHQHLVTQRLFIAPQLFVPLLLLHIRHRMSLEGVNTSIRARANFVSTLLEGKANALLLFIFFNSHQTAAQSRDYEKENKDTFLHLPVANKAELLLTFYKESQAAYHRLSDDLNQTKLSRRERRKLFTLWHKDADDSTLRAVRKAVLGENVASLYEDILTVAEKTHLLTVQV